ncbi:MAG TPA: glycosyltransferase family 9 protein, partial [Chthoniobacteraceae bacterium]|nr:glycosyltransferase family 9 protein [Chthoniobacteraceae bacterium]
APELRISERARAAADKLLGAQGVAQPFAILHPGTARAEKYWVADRWAKVADALAREHRFAIAITSGPDAFERAHAAEIQSAIREARPAILLPDDLLTLAALVERAAIVLSCDTGIVHFAAALRRPQIALFGPTNPFHWRPRHERALVISAARPDAPLAEFEPRMRGAPMDRISTEVVIRATDALLAADSSSSSSS